MSVHSVDSCDTVDTELSDQPPFCDSKMIMTKDFRKALISVHDSVPCANGFWHRQFGAEIDKHIWSLPSWVIEETKLQVLQWKLLHSRHPTNMLLCKIKVRGDQMCSSCNDVVNYIEHFFLDYPPIQIKLIWNISNNAFWVLSIFGFILTIVDVLFRIKQYDYGKIKTKRTNHIILIAKMWTSIHKKTKSFFPLSRIFENQLRVRYV